MPAEQQWWAVLSKCLRIPAIRLARCSPRRSFSSCSLVSFFKELPVVLNKLKPTLLEFAGSAADNIEQQLKLREWQETLVSLQHISNKYKVTPHISNSSS
jgi:hypothetical protein